MHGRHLPALGRRFWGALCLASIFGANMGDFFAHDVGLGHVKGLPFLAIAAGTMVSTGCVVVAKSLRRRSVVPATAPAATAPLSPAVGHVQAVH